MNSHRAESPTPERLPASFSGFHALNNISPPSPVLSPTRLPNSLTSEDIPIIFQCPSSDSIAYAGSFDDDEPTLRHVKGAGSSGSLRVPSRQPSTSRRSIIALNQDPEDLGPFQAAIPPTYESIDTFGPIRTRRKLRHSASLIEYQSASSLAEHAATTTTEDYEDHSLARHLLSKRQAYYASKQSLSDPKLSSQLPVQEDDDSSLEGQSPECPPYNSFSTLSTPRFNLPSMFSMDSIASCPSTPTYTQACASPEKKKEKVYPKSSPTVPTVSTSTSSRSISLGPGSMSVPSTPLYQVSFEDNNHSHHRLSSQVTPAPIPASSSRLHLALPTMDSYVSTVSQFSALPKKLSWLKQTTVEFLIDQEGFRAIQPVFRFAGYSASSRAFPTSPPADGSTESNMDSADFLPTSRQRFNFHYAPFDSSYPTLRRITVDNDESRDHITRQASLTMKTNGVYVVRGAETPHFTSSGDKESRGNPEQSKLRWKFEYLVSDRRIGTGKHIEGEKVFTPLVFSCSPMLLHSLQGKKIKLMHVMKKSVSPNLVAEKMEPPQPTPISPSLESPVSSPSAKRSPISPCSNANSPSTHTKGGSTVLAMPFAFNVPGRSHATKKVDRGTVSISDSPVKASGTKAPFFHLGFGKSLNGNGTTSPHKLKTKPITTSNDDDNTTTKIAKRPKGRRRASSTGEYSFATKPEKEDSKVRRGSEQPIRMHSRLDSGSESLVQGDATPEPPSSAASTATPNTPNGDPDSPLMRVDRYIIPRAILSELMSNDKPKITKPRERDSLQPLDFHPLPPPRRAHNGSRKSLNI